jgi:colicin import membrane protein
MRFLSVLLSILLHVALVIGVVLSGGLAGRTVKVDLSKPVHEVQLVQRGAPVTLPGVQPIPARKPPPPPARQMTPIKPIKAQPEQPKPPPEPKKAEQPKPPEKKGPTREEILAQALKEAQQVASKEQASERNALKQALSEIQKEVGSREQPPGHPEGLGDQPTGAVGTYLEYLQGEIRKNWRFPVMGSRDWKATVEIRIDRSGRIVGHRLMSRSGREDFDASILRAIEQTELAHMPPATHSGVYEITFHHDELL